MTKIVIPFANEPEMTCVCIKSILPTLTSRDELVLLNNNSIERNVKAVSKRYPDIPIEFSSSKNLADTLNDAMRIGSNSTFVCIMHNDAVVKNKSWLTEMRLTFDMFSETEIVLGNHRRCENAKERWISIKPTQYTQTHCLLFKKFRPVFDNKYEIKPQLAVVVKARCMLAGFAYVEHLGGGTRRLGTMQYTQRLSKEWKEMFK